MIAINNFLKDVAKLSLSTMISRGVYFISLPLITRVYSPESVSIFAIYTGIVALLSLVLTLRLDLAIQLSSSRIDALKLISASLLMVVMFTVGLLVVYHLTGLEYLGFTDLRINDLLVFTVISGSFFAACSLIAEAWLIKTKRFTSLANTRMLQSVVGAVTCVTFGYYGFTEWGMVWGNLIGLVAGLIVYSYVVFPHVMRGFRRFGRGGNFEILKKYSKYPKLSLVDGLLNVGGNQVPLIMIAGYSATIGGHISLANQLAMLPLVLIGASIGQVFTSRASGQNSRKNLEKLCTEVLSKLIDLGVMPLLVISVVAPLLFPFLFGSKWMESGLYILYMLPWFFLQLLASPISNAILLTGNHRLMFLLSLSGFLLRVGAVYVAGLIDVNYLIITLIFTNVIYYLSVLLLAKFLVGFSFKNITGRFLKIGSPVFWCMCLVYMFALWYF